MTLREEIEDASAEHIAAIIHNFRESPEEERQTLEEIQATFRARYYAISQKHLSPDQHD